jgi:hypothetical protein
MAVVSCLVILLSTAVLVGGDMVCPKLGGFWPAAKPCVNECSPDKDTCETGKKCCYTPETPCGLRCLVAKNNKPKIGKCPPSNSEQKDMNWYLCDIHLCSVDRDCGRRKKCCFNKCGGYVCIQRQ